MMPHFKTYNEAIEARKLTELLDLDNTAAVIDGDMSFKAFPLIQYHLDEPDSNPSCVPLYFLANLASQSVRVVQSGEGADELDLLNSSEYWIRSVLAEITVLLKSRTSDMIHLVHQSYGVPGVQMQNQKGDLSCT